MKTIGLILGLMMFVIVVSNIAAVVDQMNGIPNPLEKLFPEYFVDEEEKMVLETMTAPFATDIPEGAVDDAGLGVAYDPHQTERVSVNMNLPHLHEAGVNKWVMQAVAESLSFKPNEYEAHLLTLPEVMNANGLKEYKAFLKRIRAVDLMRSNNYELRTFIGDIPVLRTSGAVSGVFRWVYDVPIKMTFLPVGTRTYEDADFVTEELAIRVQLGRVSEGGRDGLVIETWGALQSK